MVGWLKTEDEKRIDELIEGVYSKTGMQYPDHKMVDVVKGYVDGKIDIRLHAFTTHNNEVSGAIKFIDRGNNNKTTILINRSKSPERQLFTLAHEFGHLVLRHGNDSENEKFRIDFESGYYPTDPKVQKEELEANYFAGAILMPEKKVKELIELDYSLEDMAAYFSVSRSALHVRMAWLTRGNRI